MNNCQALTGGFRAPASTASSSPVMLDRLLRRLFRNKDELLRVLDRSELSDRRASIAAGPAAKTDRS